MRVFVTGASGYIGGSIAVALVAAGHTVEGLVRSKSSAEAAGALGITPVLGTLDDTDILSAAARRSDVVVNAANADHAASAHTLVSALEGTGKTLIHTSGSSIVGTPAAGHRDDAIYDEATPFTPSPARAARVALNDQVLGSCDRGVRPVVLCPSLIYGLGSGAKRHSMQVPWLISLARKSGVAKHLGPGANIWSTVHIDDLVALYLLALRAAPPGAFYFAENGEHSMREICQAINRMMGLEAEPVAMSRDEAVAEWGAGPADNTMGSNSRVRAARARSELGWSPKARDLISEIVDGCYS